MKKYAICLSFLFLTYLGQSQKVENPDFDAKLQKELKHSVPEIDVNSVLELKDVVFLDARSMEEYNVSHIEGAIHVDFLKFKPENVSSLKKNAVIVVYCSVGSRSERVTEVLIKEGYKRAFNLYGGFFEWCNRNLPMVDQNENATNTIHGVTPEWAKWISSGTVVLDSIKP